MCHENMFVSHSDASTIRDSIDEYLIDTKMDSSPFWLGLAVSYLTLRNKFKSSVNDVYKHMSENTLWTNFLRHTNR